MKKIIIRATELEYGSFKKEEVDKTRDRYYALPELYAQHSELGYYDVTDIVVEDEDGKEIYRKELEEPDEGISQQEFPKDKISYFRFTENTMLELEVDDFDPELLEVSPLLLGEPWSQVVYSFYYDGDPFETVETGELYNGMYKFENGIWVDFMPDDLLDELFGAE